MLKFSTKEELYKYIDELMAKNDYKALTEDQFYEIGLLHKNLPRNQKNWQNLADYILFNGGGHRAGEAFRHFVLYRQNNDGTLALNDQEAIQNDHEEYEELYKEKTQIRDIYNAYRASLRNTARVETFLDELKNAAREMKPVHFDGYKGPKIKTNREAILMLSDVHIGADCDNFYNSYNPKIATERIQKLTNDTITYCINNGVKVLHVCNLGDIINGYIHPTLRLKNTLNVCQQVIVAVDILSNMLTKLAENIPNVIYRGCTDNHSRMFASKVENIEEENFNILVDYMLSDRLRETTIIFADDNLSPSIINFTLRDGRRVMAAHGHLENPNKVIDAFTGAIRALPDFVLLSHYHASRMKSYNGAKLFINGSVVGTEEYAESKRLFNPPEQTLLVIDGKNTLTFNIDLT